MHPDLDLHTIVVVSALTYGFFRALFESDRVSYQN